MALFRLYSRKKFVPQAMELNQIIEVIIDRIFRQFIFDLVQFRLFVVINIVKKGKWTKETKIMITINIACLKKIM